MPFDAGAVVGHFKLDDADWQAGSSRVTRSTGSLTGSVFKANLAYDAFKQAISAVAGYLSASTKEYLRQEAAIAQLNAVLKSTGGVAGVTKEAALGLASAMQNVTKFGDEAVLEAENLLLTFTKVSKDVFPAATETMLDMSTALGQDVKGSAIQLGKALQDPILGITALRRVGVNFSDAQKDVIKSLVQTGRSAEAQAMILKELQVEFGGSARAARDTFGGALAALSNRQSDLRETVGKYIATAGRPFVELMGETVLSVDQFLQRRSTIEAFTNILAPITGVLSVLVEVGRELWGMFTNLATITAGEVKEGFIDLFGTGNDASVIFQVLGTVVKAVSIGFTILGKIIAANVHWVFNLVKIARDSVEVLVALGQALADPFKKSNWERVGAAAEKTWEQIKKTGVDAFTDVKDIVTTTISEFKTLVTDGKLTGQALEAAFTEASNRIRTAMTQFYTESKTGAGAVTNDQGVAASEVRKTWIETFRELRDSMKDVTKRFGVMSSAGRASIDDLLKHVFDLAGKITSAFSNAVTGVNDVFQQYYENQQTLEDNDYAKKKAAIEANVTDEEERTKQLEALEAAHNKKSANIKKKQFAAQKIADITSAVINTAQAVMETFAQFGFPFGLIPAAIMAGIGAAQVVTIASQPTPEFMAEGGPVMPGQSVVVGEEGPELLTLGSTARVTPNDEIDLVGGRRATRDEEFILHATFIMDSRVLADFTTRAVRNGQIIIEAKDVR